MAIGQAEIEQHHVPPLSERKRHRFCGGARLTELHTLRQTLQDLDQPAPDQRVIVDDENANHRPDPAAPRAGGDQAATPGPPPSPRATSRKPPSTAPRSRLPPLPRE